MNARDVFVRRPQCTSLWIVPIAAIFSRTSQELDAGSPPAEPQADEKRAGYYVFAKHKQAGTHLLAGEVTATSPGSALNKARQQLHDLEQALVIWVCPVDAVYKSSATEAESLFSPARDKPYRMAADFHTVTAMREVRKES